MGSNQHWPLFLCPVKQDRKAVSEILQKENIDLFGATSCGEFIDGHQSKGEIVILLMDLSRDAYTILLEDMGGRSIQEVSVQVSNSAISQFANPAADSLQYRGGSERGIIRWYLTGS